MTTLSPELTECIEAIDATFGRIQQTLAESARDHADFMVKLAAVTKQLEDARRGRAE